MDGRSRKESSEIVDEKHCKAKLKMANNKSPIYLTEDYRINVDDFISLLLFPIKRRLH